MSVYAARISIAAGFETLEQQRPFLIGQDGGEEAVSESLRCAEASRARHWTATGPPGSMELFTRLMLAVLPRQKSEIKDDEERQARHHAGIQPSSARMPHATLAGPRGRQHRP